MLEFWLSSPHPVQLISVVVSSWVQQPWHLRNTFHGVLPQPWLLRSHLLQCSLSLGRRNVIQMFHLSMSIHNHSQPTLLLSPHGTFCFFFKIYILLLVMVAQAINPSTWMAWGIYIVGVLSQKKITYVMFVGLNVYVYIYVKGCWILWKWSYRHFWAATGCWELNLDLLEEQQLLLARAFSALLRQPNTWPGFYLQHHFP